MAAIVQHVLKFATTLEASLLRILGGIPPPEHYALALVGASTLQPSTKQSSYLNDLLGDSILWAVPKRRRTLEVRRTRRFGLWKGVNTKMIPMKTNLLTCIECGGAYEAGHLCNTCYEKIKEITLAMQEEIQKKLGFSPVEKEVAVLFKGEKKEDNPKKFKGKHIIEVKKVRPFFCQNLLQKSTQGEDTETTAVTVVKPVHTV